MIRQFELVERVADYDSHVDEDLLNRAYVFSMKAHGSQLRASGDPYFSHPVEVAAILADYKLDCATIVTALLHDTVEDTLATVEEIKQTFGDDIGQLVDGVTKLAKLELQPEANQQAENLRKLVLAMSNDIRVLLVKLADRLHNMRTLHHLRSPEKRLRIATETMEIYAPLAERLGMQRLKQELEDLAFAEQNPDARESVLRRLEFLHDDGEDPQERISAELEQTCEAAGIPVEVSSRVKTPYSIWHKMQRNHVAFEQLSDTVAFRLIVDTVADCYQVLGVVHGTYKMVPGRFKDYLSTPKANNYQSLHTTVIGPENRRIEIQIRTSMMHRIAELGVAAHWQYKQGLGDVAGSQYSWLRELLDILEHAQTPEEFLEHTKLEMFSDQVFGFTPRGDLINLPHGATAVDFAYAVHSEVGDRCVGAKINGKMVPIRSRLKSGDTVEILTSKNQTPSKDWLNIVKTSRARSKIRQWLQKAEREINRDAGISILDKGLRVFSSSIKALKKKNMWNGVLEQFHCKSEDELYVNLGSGKLSIKDIISKTFPPEGDEQESEKKMEVIESYSEKLSQKARQKSSKKNAIIVDGMDDLMVRMARCCNPIPGDQVIGYITRGRGITVHTHQCNRINAREVSREIDVSWNEEFSFTHPVNIRVVTHDKPGVLSLISRRINEININIRSATAKSMPDRKGSFLFEIEVKDYSELLKVINSIEALEEVISVTRI